MRLRFPRNRDDRRKVRVYNDFPEISRVCKSTPVVKKCFGKKKKINIISRLPRKNGHRDILGAKSFEVWLRLLNAFWTTVSPPRARAAAAVAFGTINGLFSGKYRIRARYFT